MLRIVKQFKEITCKYDAPSGMTVLVYTDIPPGDANLTNTAKRTLSFPATSGTRTKTLPLDIKATGEILEGTLIRVRWTSSGVVRLFGATVKFRRIGVYFDGAFSPEEFFETLEQGFGL